MKILRTQTNLSGLNSKQIDAVLTEHKRVLVLAGAGSGKTKTLLQKLIYLINDKNVKPSNILAITFTKNAANEMIDRLIISADESGEYEKILFDKKISVKEKDNLRFKTIKKYAWINSLTIKTFHSLCYSLIRNYGVHIFDNKFRILSDQKVIDEQFTHLTAPETEREIMKKTLIEASENKNFLLDLKRYILDYIVDKIHLKDLDKNKRYFDGKFYTTLKGDRVRSKSERDIADWLYRHNIKYEYELNVYFKKFKCKPDFYLPQANMFIEHVSDKSFPLKQKEEQFEDSGKLYVKIFEEMANDSTLFNLALERIIKGRLSQNYKPELAISFEEEFKSYHDNINDFVSLLLRVNNMIKVENLSYDTILKKGKADQHERISAFYDLAVPLFKKYNDYCRFKSFMDFNDMIIKAVELLNSQKDITERIQHTYKYILVDEFQDVNNLQVELINKMLTPATQLFCVGDDWQSIYGFRGSEVDYIVNFENHFEKPEIIKLNLNYRSTNFIVGASNEVIKNNKFQVAKEIHSSKKSDKRINIFAADSEADELDYFITEVRRLLGSGYNPDDILVLYRRSKMFNPFFQRLRKEGLRIKGKTIHSSKGLEAKAVFIIGLTEGNGGFPDIWLDDRVFQVIRKVKHDMLMEEERRLFYVALTRAKDELFLLTRKGNESSFLDEIPEEYSINFNHILKPVIDAVLLCENCNNQLHAHFLFCPNCGTKIE
jgi:superfamily I DNA/RNA helicase